MLKGLTSQLMPTVTAIPRHCSVTRCKAPKSTLSSIGTIISQISTATGILTWATFIRPSAWKGAGQKLAEHDPSDDAERDPQGQVALEQTQRRRCCAPACIRNRAHAVSLNLAYAGFRASTVADATKSSMPLPRRPGGDHLAAFRLWRDPDIGEAGCHQPCLDPRNRSGAGNAAAKQRIVGL